MRLSRISILNLRTHTVNESGCNVTQPANFVIEQCNRQLCRGVPETVLKHSRQESSSDSLPREGCLSSQGPPLRRKWTALPIVSGVKLQMWKCELLQRLHHLPPARLNGTGQVDRTREITPRASMNFLPLGGYVTPTHAHSPQILIVMEVEVAVHFYRLGDTGPYEIISVAATATER